MNKFLKLTGVSMLAIMTASGANAAGYTCEELIEYTSCNPGYYFSTDKCSKDAMYITGVCDWTEFYDNVSWNMTEEECYEEESGAIYRTEACLRAESVDEDNSYAEGVYVTEVNLASCFECTAGSYCTGGTADATLCPAGSYCAGDKLDAPTGVCAKGFYAEAGATTCTECPASILTGANGNAVSVTTEDTGSTSSSACYVAKGTTFENEKGTYKYTDNCAYSGAIQFYEPSNGTCADGYYYSEAYEGGNGVVISDTGCYLIPTNEESCNQASGWWTGETCECDMEWYGDAVSGIYDCSNS